MEVTVVDTDIRAAGDAGLDPGAAATADNRANRLSASFSRIFRLNARMRAEPTAVRFDGREVPTLVVLHRLAEQGPLRAGALAEHLHMDPSQVSRAVAALVREQAVQRLADPDDRRATLLVTTPAGRELAERFARAKSAHLASIIADWDPADAEAFTAGLERFVAGLEQHVPSRHGQHQPAHVPHLPTGPDGDDATDPTPADPGATT